MKKRLILTVFNDFWQLFGQFQHFRHLKKMQLKNVDNDDFKSVVKSKDFRQKLRFVKLIFNKWIFLMIFYSKTIENPYNLHSLRKTCIMFVSYPCVPLCTFVQMVFNLCLVSINETQKINTCTGLVLVLWGPKFHSDLHSILISFH